MCLVTDGYQVGSMYISGFRSTPPVVTVRSAFPICLGMWRETLTNLLPLLEKTNNTQAIGLDKLKGLVIRNKIETLLSEPESPAVLGKLREILPVYARLIVGVKQRECVLGDYLDAIAETIEN